jgi:uncharacterized protein
MDLVIVQTENTDTEKIEDILKQFEINIIHCFIKEDWENDRSFFDIISNNQYFFIITTKKSFNEKSFKFIVGYCLGKNCSLYLYLTETDIVIPEKLSFIRYSYDLLNLTEYYNEILNQWKKKNEINTYKNLLTEKGLYFTPYHFFNCIEKDDFEAVSYFLKAEYSPDIINEKGVSAFNYAVRYNKIKIAKLLIEYNCDIYYISKDNHHNSLMEAAVNGNNEFCEYLITRSIDLNVQSKNDQTALMIAAGRNDEVVVELLLKSGADTGIKDVLDMTVTMYAEILKYKGIISLLKKYRK